MIGGQHRYAADQFGGGRHDPHARSAVRAWFTVNCCAAGVPMMFMGMYLDSHATLTPNTGLAVSYKTRVTLVILDYYFLSSKGLSGQLTLGICMVMWLLFFVWIMLWQTGTEWAQPGWWNCDEHRRPDWSLAKDDIGVQMIKFISGAMGLRKKYPALRLGATNILHEDRGNGVIAVERVLEGAARIIVVLNAGLGHWQSSEYGVHVGGSNYSVEEVFASQSAEFGAWEDQHSNAGAVISVHDGQIFINVPMQSAAVFTPVI
jgi:hypothetical protein